MVKRVLIITYYWPPTGGSGVQRWLKFTKYLPSYGWQPIVYTPENPDNDLRDETLMNDISKETVVLKKEIWDPSSLVTKTKPTGQKNDGYSVMESKSKLMRIFKWIRGNLFIPDSRVLWRRSSVNYLTTYLKTSPVDLIVTTGPPHSLHLIGSHLQLKTKTRWIMDLRDPMSMLITNQELQMTTWALNRYKRIEKRLLNQADAIIATSAGMPKMLSKFDQKKFYTITNGYDGSDFKTWSNPPIEPFILTHAGLLNQYRIPHALLQILENLLTENRTFEKDFEFRIAGVVADSFKQTLDGFPLVKSKIRFLGYLSHQEVLKLYSQSTMLLLLMNDDSHYAAGTIPGKLFEYLAARRPILSLGPANSVYSEWFERDFYSAHFDYQDNVNIEEYLLNVASKIGDYEANQNKYPEFERQQLTSELASVFDKLIQNEPTKSEE